MKYFKKSEFKCKCGCGLDNVNERFLQRLDFARELAGIPFVINSGCRCETHNKAVGGVNTSSHLATVHQSSHAADIDCPDSRSRQLILAALMQVGFNRIGIADTFIHVDDDPGKTRSVIWTY